MDTIFRVQDENGYGPYRPNYMLLSDIQNDIRNDILYGDLLRLKRVEDTEDDPHPTPCADKLIQRNCEMHEYFGFIDHEQALNWFPQEILDKLEKIGFFLCEVKGTITAIGEKQVLFKKETHDFEVENKDLPFSKKYIREAYKKIKSSNKVLT